MRVLSTNIPLNSSMPFNLSTAYPVHQQELKRLKNLEKELLELMSKVKGGVTSTELPEQKRTHLTSSSVYFREEIDRILEEHVKLKEEVPDVKKTRDIGLLVEFEVEKKKSEFGMLMCEKAYMANAKLKIENEKLELENSVLKRQMNQTLTEMNLCHFNG